MDIKEALRLADIVYRNMGDWEWHKAMIDTKSTLKEHRQALQTLIDYCSEPKEGKGHKYDSTCECKECLAVDFPPTLLGKSIEEMPLRGDKKLWSLIDNYFPAFEGSIGAEGKRALFEQVSKLIDKRINEPTKEVSEPKVELEELALGEFLNKLELWWSLPGVDQKIRFVNGEKVAKELCSHFKLSVPSVCKYAVISQGIGLSGKIEEIKVHCKMNPENDYTESIA